MDDSKKTVAKGYDKVATAYLTWSQDSKIRLRFLQQLLTELTASSRILDLGCGAGIPVAKSLVENGHNLIGVDISPEQIRMAKTNVPGGRFLHEDMTELAFEPCSFDAVIAFYSITHVPRDEHLVLLSRIETWLTPGGLLLASFGVTDLEGWHEDDWLGAPNFFSQFDAPTNLNLLRDAGFQIEQQKIVAQDEQGEDAQFLWVTARKGI